MAQPDQLFDLIFQCRVIIGLMSNVLVVTTILVRIPLFVILSYRRWPPKGYSSLSYEEDALMILIYLRV